MFAQAKMGSRPFLIEEMVCARSGQPKKDLLCWEGGGEELSVVGREGIWEGVVEEEGKGKSGPDFKRSYVSKTSYVSSYSIFILFWKKWIASVDF